MAGGRFRSLLDAIQFRSFELRPTRSMARLLRDQSKRDEARDLLAPVYGWFTEGFDTLDLKEAKARRLAHSIMEAIASAIVKRKRSLRAEPRDQRKGEEGSVKLSKARLEPISELNGAIKSKKHSVRSRLGKGKYPTSSRPWRTILI